MAKSKTLVKSVAAEVIPPNRGHFQRGSARPDGAGRRSGELYGVRARIANKLDEMGVDPITGLALLGWMREKCAPCRGKGKVAKDANKKLSKSNPLVQCTFCHGTTFEYIPPELRARCRMDLANYLFPKRKAIEVADSGGTGKSGYTLFEAVQVLKDGALLIDDEEGEYGE